MNLIVESLYLIVQIVNQRSVLICPFPLLKLFSDWAHIVKAPSWQQVIKFNDASVIWTENLSLKRVHYLLKNELGL